MSEEIKPCDECGMPVNSGEYHPYAACLMFKACHNSEIVQANLDAVVFHGIEICEAAAPTPPAPPADQVFMQLTGGMKPTIADLSYIAPEPSAPTNELPIDRKLVVEPISMGSMEPVGYYRKVYFPPNSMCRGTFAGTMFSETPVKMDLPFEPCYSAEQLATLQAELEQAEKDAKRYAARRKSAFLVSMRMQISGTRRTEGEFNFEYDTASDNNIAGYVVDHRGVFVKDEAMTIAKYEVKKS